MRNRVLLALLFVCVAAGVAVVLLERPAEDPLQKGALPRRDLPAPPEAGAAAEPAPSEIPPGGKPPVQPGPDSTPKRAAAKPAASKLAALFEAARSQGDPALSVLRAGLRAGDERVIDLVLADEEFAPSLGPQLLLAFPGRGELAARVLEKLPSDSPRRIAERARLGDPEALAQLLKSENRMTGLLDSILGGRPASMDEARAQIQAIGSSGYRDYAVEKAGQLLAGSPPVTGTSEHAAYHAFFHRMSFLGLAAGEKADLLERYVLAHAEDPWFASSCEGRLNVCQVLAEAGSVVGVAGLVDLISRPGIAAFPARGEPGKLGWKRVEDRDPFLMTAFHAERTLLCLTDFTGGLGACLDYNPVAKKLVYDSSQAEEARAAWRAWWLKERDVLEFDPGTRRFFRGAPSPERSPLWEKMDRVREFLASK